MKLDFIYRSDARLNMKTNAKPSISTNAKMATVKVVNHNTKDLVKVEEIVNQYRKKYADRLPFPTVVKLPILPVDKLQKAFVERFHESNVTRFRDTIAARSYHQ